jgi:hypothetical protein
MRTSKPVIKKEETAGDKAAKAAKIRAGELVSAEDLTAPMHVKAHDPLSDPIKPPKWVKPVNTVAYIEMIKAVCKIEFDNISEFCRNNNVTTATIYNWLRHQDTKDLIDAQGIPNDHLSSALKRCLRSFMG